MSTLLLLLYLIGAAAVNENTIQDLLDLGRNLSFHGMQSLAVNMKASQAVVPVIHVPDDEEQQIVNVEKLSCELGAGAKIDGEDKIPEMEGAAPAPVMERAMLSRRKSIRLNPLRDRALF